MSYSEPALKTNLALIRRMVRRMGAARIHTLLARPDAVFYFVNPDSDAPGSPPDSDQLHFEFQDSAVLFLAVFPLDRVPRDELS